MADLAGGDQPSFGVDAVSEPAPMIMPDSALGTIGPGPEEMSHDVSMINRNMAPPGLEQFHREQTQPDREPIMNALGMLHMIGNTFLPKSHLPGAQMRPPSPAQQAPELWQRPPIEAPPIENPPVMDPTVSMRPPPLADTQISNTLVQPQSTLVPMSSLPSMEPMQPPMMAQPQPSMMQQGNAAMLERFNSMTPEQQLQVLTSALGLGFGGGVGYGMMNNAQQPRPEPEPSWYGVPAPRAIQR